MSRCRVKPWVALVAALLPALGPDAPRAAGQTGFVSYVNFSFDQVDLRLLAKLVGDMTGKRFVLDQAVSGKVTVVTPPQIPSDEVYPLFLSILESSGYSVVEEDGACRVVALGERAVTPARVVGADEAVPRTGLITKVIRLENISAVELKKVLEPMVRGGKAGALAVFGPTNHLIITDTSENIRRVEQVIAELDKRGAANVMEYVRLKHASAEEIALALNAAMKGAGAAGGAVSRHIQQVAEGAGSLPTDVVLVPAIGANSLVLVGAPVQINELRRVIALMDVEPEPTQGRLNAIFLKYLSAEEAAKGLNALLAKTVEKDARQRIAIEPSTANNALMVEASPSDFELVRALVQKLDQVPQQVLVEILIAEIGMNKDIEFGVQWHAIETPEGGQVVAAGGQLLADSDEISDLLTESVFPKGLVLGVSKGVVNADGTVTPKIPLLVKALAEDRDVKILSNVPLWAQNNTEATVSVVENIPILKSTIEGGAGTARDVIQNIDRLDVGIKLKFTPHVNPDREVTMQLNPSIEAIIDEGPADTQFAPTIAKREVSTTVTVPDKATIIISGLIREDQVKTVAKVPILGDIPLLGMLFRHSVDSRQRTNLLIFVTPHIVTDVREAAAMKKTWEDRSSMQISATNLLLKPAKRK